MRNVFTKNLILLGFCLLGFSIVQAQNLNTLIINSPAGIAGSYQMLRADWGSQSNNPITADAAFGQYGNPPAYDGCAALTNNVTGKIVFMDRVTCALDLKCKNAQNAGAIAAIICNNLAAPEPMFKMVAGTEAASLNIPCFITTKEVCDKIRVDIISGGVNATIGYECKVPEYEGTAVWGTNPGEGDFSDGLNGWTVDKGWVANVDGLVRQGAYTGTPRFLGSATACNGSAEFNSDHLDNESIAGNFGAGECPSPCTGFLLSPVIDLDTPLDGLTIEFTQGLRQFQSRYYVMVSIDSGATFKDTIQINQQYPVNSNHIAERIKVAFSGYEGVSSVRFKFEIVGDYYYWNIDDVVVYNESIIDVFVDRAWYSVSPQYKVPASQVSEIPFMADLGNLGNSSATAVNLEVNVTGPSSSVDYELNLGDFDPSTRYENNVFPQTYTPPAVVGRYFGEYKVTSIEEDGGPNNTAGFDFHVTDMTYANLETEVERNAAYMEFYATPWLNIPDSKYYTISNAYFVKQGTDYTVTKVRFGLGNVLADVEGRSIRVDLFEWIDLSGDNIADANERVRVGSSFVFIDSSIDNLRNIETDLWAVDPDGFPEEGVRVMLKNNATYLLAASTSPNSDNDPRMDLLGFTPRALDNQNRSVGHHLATNFTFDELDIERVSGSFHGWENTSSPSIEDIDMRSMRQIINGALYTKAYLEMDIDLKSNVVDNTIPTIEVITFPNPTSRDLYIDMSLEKVSKEVKVTLFDIKGSVIFTQVFNNVLDDRLKIDLNDVSNGIYTVSIVSEEGQVAKKVVVQK